MKKKIIIASLIILCSCTGDNAPKCDDPKIIETVLSILTENTGDLLTEYGQNHVIINAENTKITNIMTVSNDEKLKSCGCEGTVDTETYEGNVKYVAQENSEGEIIVKIDDAGPFFVKQQ